MYVYIYIQACNCFTDTYMYINVHMLHMCFVCTCSMHVLFRS